MIATNIILSFVVVVGATLVGAYKPYEGVDPNTLSCDPAGQIHLLLPHFYDCDKFMMCTHGKEVEFLCAAGTIFDFELQTCNHIWATTCVLRTPPGEDTDEGSGDDHWGSGDETGTLNSFIEVNPHFSSSVINCHLSDSASTRVPYQGDCQRYWRCENGMPVATVCSDGLFFNSKTEQCDFEANTKCTETLTEELGEEFLVYH